MGAHLGYEIFQILELRKFWVPKVMVSLYELESLEFRVLSLGFRVYGLSASYIGNYGVLVYWSHVGFFVSSAAARYLKVSIGNAKLAIARKYMP